MAFLNFKMMPFWSESRPFQCVRIADAHDPDPTRDRDIYVCPDARPDLTRRLTLLFALASGVITRTSTIRIPYWRIIEARLRNAEYHPRFNVFGKSE